MISKVQVNASLYSFTDLPKKNYDKCDILSDIISLLCEF